MKLSNAILSLAVVLGLMLPVASIAHELQPGYAALDQIDEGRWQIYWRKPDVAGRAMAIDLLLPETCLPRTGPDVVPQSGSWEADWVAVCEGGLAGKLIAVPGLDQTQTDVLIRFAPLDKPSVSLRLTADETSVLLPEDPDWQSVFSAYAGLGFEHILEGWDHLLFLFALLVLIPDFWRLVGAVTAFTVAHSLTLVASTFGWISLPGAPVEAVIALSIVFLAVEIISARDDERRLSQTAPWLVTFAFGLLHGLGFAGALKEIGLPQADIPLALLAFNVGVELGQLVFVMVAAIALSLLSLPFGRRAVMSHRPVVVVMAYAIGGVSSYWLIERIVSFT
ncbi:HupE/UreJ family protein [Roseibium sp.]|uniref:HupE/UreJ family protein n=2 Tax=Roseibium sp. TaxID=1936156 RepID=UPI0039EF156C